MNSTNVPSKKDNPTIVVGQTIPTEKGLEIPPKTAQWGVSKEEVNKAEKQGEIVISQVGISKLKPDGTLEMQDGNSITMKPHAYETLLEAKKQKAEMKEKARKIQSGMEIG